MSSSIEKFKEIEEKSKIKYKSQGFGTKKCGQTVLSMITGFSVEDICERLGKSKTTYLLSDIKPFLEKNGFVTDYKKVRKFEDVPNYSILLLEYPDESNTGHFTLKIDNEFFDPLVGTVSQYNEETRLPHSYLSFKQKVKD
ncbi:hypothetical protein SAMN04489761_3045 [Tenacibaculum sp. MAR_2009_124]|uniref:hypothetical protein n=1 Tax=Tenacibaculum sp. MAR_2009_124 TaxID=1250059 RepID=UPI0008974785|nr:hypothetical protein [Tenacibaculum sp. MAR_2009_124]SEC45675.1 hypothetical protein SAMN04489761_3045 [Tenacibaculum sp. MAR_2009_124]